MIATNMKIYPFYLYAEPNEYGEQELSPLHKGVIRMAIYLSSQSVQDNINYKDCQYVGLTKEFINDSYVIKYGNERLKVLCVNRAGRLTQVFMTKI